MNEKEIRFIDLFGGIGGFHLGLNRANDYKSASEKRKSSKRGNGDIDKQRNKFHSGSTSASGCIRPAQQKNSKRCIPKIKKYTIIDDKTGRILGYITKPRLEEK